MPRTILIADSGSTKTDWLLLSPATGRSYAFTSAGLNPCLAADEAIVDVLASEVLPHLQSVGSVSAIRFYGAGCRPDQIERMQGLLQQQLDCADATVASDLLGAAHALCGTSSGIVAILGTGSGSAVYDGHGFTHQTPSLGYVLGDEGSGAVLGRRLLGDIFKGQLPPHLVRAFAEEEAVTVDEAIRRVYREPAPNRYLAQFTRFLSAHRDEASIRALLVDEFARFFQRNILPYQRPDLPVHFVGSIAHVFAPELHAAAAACQSRVGRIMKSPIEGLEEFVLSAELRAKPSDKIVTK